jgi:CDP-diacylglycerol--serine O-phosphatidyltransferase
MTPKVAPYFCGMRWIPNALTLGNVACGMAAIWYLMFQNFEYATAAVMLAFVFDGLDGWAARKVGVSGELGVQLDSLADAITFGVVPGFMWMQLAMWMNTGYSWPALPVLGWAVTLASVYRLARFNSDMKDYPGFLGMPTPANTAFVVGLLFAADAELIPIHPGCYLAALAWSVYSLNAPFTVASFKDLPSGWLARGFRLAWLAVSLAAFALWGLAAMAVAVPLLPVVSALEKRFL